MNQPTGQGNQGQQAAAAPISIDDLEKQLGGELAMDGVRKEYWGVVAAFLQKARGAAADYSARRDELSRRWEAQEAPVAGLLGDLKNKPGWDKSCGPIAGMFKAIADAAAALEPPDKASLPAPVGDQGLYWKRAGLLATRDTRRRDYERCKLDLAVWEKPAQTLDKVLSDNQKLIDDASKAMQQPCVGTLLYDVAFKLVPLHLMIAPAAGSTIDPATTVCGQTLAQLKDLVAPVAGPLPSLIPEGEFGNKCSSAIAALKLSMESLARAEKELSAIEAEIARTVAAAAKGKTIDKDARALLTQG